MGRFFAAIMTLLLHAIRACARERQQLVLENIALRQQVMVLSQKRPRPSLHDGHRTFWVALHSAWSGWRRLLVIVDPDTVVRWHRRRFDGTGPGYRAVVGPVVRASMSRSAC